MAIDTPNPRLEGWTPGFFEKLSTVDPETAAAVDELLASVRRAKKSKPSRSALLKDGWR